MCIRDSITTDIVTVFPTPTVKFTVLDSINCGPFIVDFYNTSLAQNSEDTTSMSFWWIVNNDTLGFNSTFQHIFDPNIGDTADYNVTLIGQTEHGCIDSMNMTISVIPNPIAQLNTISDSIQRYCAPVHIDSLAIQAIPYIGAQPNSDISWEVIDSTGTIVAIGTGLNCPPYIITDQNDYVWVVITAVNDCDIDQDSIQIWTSEDPVADFEYEPEQGCHPLTVITDTTINSSTGSYTWNVWNISNNPATLDTTIFTINISTPIFLSLIHI